MAKHKCVVMGLTISIEFNSVSLRDPFPSFGPAHESKNSSILLGLAPLWSKYKLEAQASEYFRTKHTRSRVVLVRLHMGAKVALSIYLPRIIRVGRNKVAQSAAGTAQTHF